HPAHGHPPGTHLRKQAVKAGLPEQATNLESSQSLPSSIHQNHSNRTSGMLNIAFQSFAISRSINLDWLPCCFLSISKCSVISAWSTDGPNRLRRYSTGTRGSSLK